MGTEALSRVTELLGTACYAALAAVAVWGLYCAVVVWRRAAAARFRDERQQAEFLQYIDELLAGGNFEAVADQCRNDPRAAAQLILLAVENRRLGYNRVRHLVADLFQRDVLADLQHRVSWITTVIKTAPMLGLFGTVLGMMAAFGKLGAESKVDPTALSEDISLALITTALGLAIAIPLSLCVASINIRLRKLEDMVGLGMTRFMDSFRDALTSSAASEP